MKEPLARLLTMPSNYPMLLNNSFGKRDYMNKTGEIKPNNLIMKKSECSPATSFSHFIDKIPQGENGFPMGNSNYLQIMASMQHFSTFLIPVRFLSHLTQIK